MADKTKQAARAIQRRTGWSYSGCRRVVVALGPADAAAASAAEAELFARVGEIERAARAK